MKGRAFTEFLVILALLIATAIFTSHAKAQMGGPNSGTWIVTPRHGDFQTIYGPNGQHRTYVYPPSGNASGLAGFQQFSNSLRDMAEARRQRQAREAWMDEQMDW